MVTLIRGGPESLDPVQVGNKFARLEQMRRAGMRVPPLFCLPASAFDAALAKTLDSARGAAPFASAPADAVEKWCADLASALRSLTIPAEWAEPVLRAFDAQFGAGALVAVRACVVPAIAEQDQQDQQDEQHESAEDGASDPFAGMSDSYLYVTRDRLWSRIAACWASAFTDRAVRYRIWRGLDPTRARVAVGIQQMILGTRSFVAFTRDPRNGDRRVVIAAAHGIGEGVVQEKADVDHFFVKDGRVEAEVVRKERMVGRPAPGGHGELAVLPVPPEWAERPVLAEREAVQIAELGIRVEQFFGGPQDIEGTITGDGTVHLVQARPMVMAKDPSRRSYWGNHNITESYPGISGALTYSQAQEFYRRSFGDLYRRMGVSRRRFDSNKHHLEQMVAFLNGRIYYRLSAWHALHGQMPVFELVRPLWEEAMGITGPAREGPRWSRARAFASLPAALLRALGHPRQVREFLRWWDGLMIEAGDLSDRTPEQLIEFYRRMWAGVSVRWGITLTNSVYGMLALRALTHLLAKWAGADRRLLVGLLASGRPNRSLQAVRAAIELAERISERPELKAAVLETRSTTSKQVWRDLSAGRYGDPLARAATDYIKKFGDRAMHDLKLEEPTPRQRPWMVLDMLRPYVQQGLSMAKIQADEERTTRQAREELIRHCPNPLQRGVLRLLAAGARSSIAIREDTRFCRTQLYGLSRQIMWSLGGQLAKTGQLENAMDVRDLTVSEVMGAFDGTLPGSDLRGLVALRRSEREQYTSRAPSDSLLSTEANIPLHVALDRAIAVASEESITDQGMLHGLGSSAGVVRAPARLVLEPSVAADSCQGTILVARETDPGWLFLMMAAKGLVVERGTLLSHTAITGRLLGIPTIVAVAGATTRIPDGAIIEIDGSAGTVRIVESPSPS